MVIVDRRFLSRKGKDFSRRFPRVFAALKECLPNGTLIDGEVVAFDETGQLSFNALQNADPDANLVFFAFDVLVYRWKDLTHLPLSERMSLLKNAIRRSEQVQSSEHFPGPASKFVAAVHKMGGEGVVAKRLTSRYEPGRRSGAWSKRRINIGQEFVIGGFTPGSNGIDALVVAHERRELTDSWTGFEIHLCPL
jgi:ATP-dependent DNA ligase